MWHSGRLIPDTKPGKGGTRKIGRLGRSPSHNRYNAENRCEKNKKRKAAKQKLKELKQAARKKKRNDSKRENDFSLPWEEKGQEITDLQDQDQDKGEMSAQGDNG